MSELKKKYADKKIKIMSALIWITLMVLPVVNALACEVCKDNQPEVLKGITHGAGPQGSVDFVIVPLASAIVLIALVLALKCLIKPNENKPGHIKYIIVE